MSKYRVLIETVDASNTKGVKDLQKKINTWMSTGLLKKYEVLTASNVVVFNICLLKEAKAPF